MSNPTVPPGVLDAVFAEGADWRVKVDRARHHLADLSSLVTSYRESDPARIEPERTETAGEIAWRLRIDAEPPAELGVIVGDLLHNLRSALDSLAYALVRAYLGRELTADEVGATAYPVCETPEAFDKDFMTRRRAALYAEPLRIALRKAQPFAMDEHIANDYPDVQPERPDYAWHHKYDHGARLHALNIIDKHRHLTVATWWPDLPYWTSNGDTQRTLHPGDGTVANGSVLYRMRGDDDGDTHLYLKFVLALTDDPPHPLMAEHGYTPDDLPVLMTRLVEYVVTRANLVRHYLDNPDTAPMD